MAEIVIRPVPTASRGTWTARKEFQDIKRQLQTRSVDAETHRLQEQARQVRAWEGGSGYIIPEDANLTSREQKILQDYGPDEVNRLRRIAGERAGVAAMKKSAVQLPSGEWVGKEAYEAMPVKEQARLRELSLKGYQNYIEIEDRKFKAKNIEVRPGEWVDRGEFNRQSGKDQIRIKQIGIDAWGLEKDKEYTAAVKAQERVPEVIVGKELKQTGVELGTGEYVSKEEFNKLSPDYQDKLKRVGVKSFNKWVEWKDRASLIRETEFKEVNIEIKPGEWVLRTEWNKLTLPQQKEVKETGSYTIQEVITEPAQEPPAFSQMSLIPPIPTDWRKYTPQKEEYGETLGGWFKRVGKEVRTFGAYKPEWELTQEYEKEQADAALEGKYLASPTTGGVLTQAEYSKEMQAQIPGWGKWGKQMAVYAIPGEYLRPSRLAEYEGMGPKGYAMLAGFAAADIASLIPVIGWIGKGVSTGLKLTSTAGKIASLGGRAAVKQLAIQAAKDLVQTTGEIGAKRILVNQAQDALAIAVKKKSVDTVLRQTALTFAQKELQDAVINHTARVAAATTKVTNLNKLAKAANLLPTELTKIEKVYGGALKTQMVAGKIATPAWRTFGAIELGIVGAFHKEMSPIEIAAHSAMAALGFGVPGKVLGAIKSQGELIFRPGRIPSRAIQVPETYLPGLAGMPKTSVAGMSIPEQLKAMQTSSEVMETLWKGAGKAQLPWPGSKGLTYGARSEFQSIVSKAAIHAAPDATVFQRPIYKVAGIAEPAQYFAPWGFPQFTEASATGAVKGAKPTYLALFSEGIKDFPQQIAGAATPTKMWDQAKKVLWSQQVDPGVYPGFKLYNLAKEPEFIVPMGTEIGTAAGGVGLWTRATPFGKKITIQPKFIVAEEAARRYGFTFTEAIQFKLKGIPAELRHLRDTLSLKKGITGEASIFSHLRDFISDAGTLKRRLQKELAELQDIGASAEKIAAKRAELSFASEGITGAEKRLGALERARAKSGLRVGLGRGITESLLRPAFESRSMDLLGSGEVLSRELRIEPSRGVLPRISNRGFESFRQTTLRELERGIPRMESLEVPRRIPLEEFRGGMLRVPRFESFRQISLRDLGGEVSRIDRPEPFRRVLIGDSRLEVPRVGRGALIERTQVDRVDVPRVDAPRIDITRTDIPRTDISRVDAPRIDSPRVDLPRVDLPRTDLPRTDQPRIKLPPIFPPIPSGGKKERKLPEGTVIWQQGFMKKTIPPPHSGITPFSEYNPVPKGEGSPYTTFRVIGRSTIKGKVDLGVTDIAFDKEIEFTGDGGSTNVGRRDPSPYRGMTVKRKKEGQFVRM